MICGTGVPHKSTEEHPGCLGCIGDEILPKCMGILISQYKDPYKPTSGMESRRLFFVAQGVIDNPTIRSETSVKMHV